MSKKDYSNTIIYMICCKDPEIHYKYVGATTKLRQRSMIHRKLTAEKKQEEPYTVINENGGWDNWEVVVLEHYEECVNIEQSNYRVKEWKNKFVSHFSTDFTPKSTDFVERTTENTQKIDSGHICKWCSNPYSRSDSLKRHESKCKSKPNENVYKVQIEKLEKLVEQLAEQNKKLMENQVQPRNIRNKKITNNNNNNNNTINNGTINNITYRLEIGNENAIEKLSDRQQKEILGKMHGSLLHYIEKIHFSGEFPECMNVALTNLRSKYAYKYSENEQKFIAMVANDVFEHLIDTRLEEICYMFDEKRKTLKPIIEERMGEFIEGMKNNPDKKKQAMDDVKLMAYNNKDKIEGQITP